MKTSLMLACGPSLTPGLMLLLLLWPVACVLFIVNLFLIFAQPEPARFWHLLFSGACAVLPFVLPHLAAYPDPWLSRLVSLSLYQLPLAVIGQFLVLLATTLKNKNRKRHPIVAGEAD